MSEVPIVGFYAYYSRRRDDMWQPYSEDRHRKARVSLYRCRLSTVPDDELKVRLSLLSDLAYLRTAEEDFELEAIQEELTARDIARKRAEVFARHRADPAHIAEVQG